MRITALFSALIILFLAALTSAAQTGAPAKPNPMYDAELAKKLGGDDSGMKSYILAILKTGPNDASIGADEKKKLFAGHMAAINRLASEGKLAVAGPFGKNDKAYRGIYIFNVATVEDAQKLAETDPAIKAGVFVLDLTPWYGSASLMATPEIHKKISKTIE